MFASHNVACCKSSEDSNNKCLIDEQIGTIDRLESKLKQYEDANSKLQIKVNELELKLKLFEDRFKIKDSFQNESTTDRSKNQRENKGPASLNNQHFNLGFGNNSSPGLAIDLSSQIHHQIETQQLVYSNNSTIKKKTCASNYQEFDKFNLSNKNRTFDVGSLSKSWTSKPKFNSCIPNIKSKKLTPNAAFGSKPTLILDKYSIIQNPRGNQTIKENAKLGQASTSSLFERDLPLESKHKPILRIKSNKERLRSSSFNQTSDTRLPKLTKNKSMQILLAKPFQDCKSSSIRLHKSSSPSKQVNDDSRIKSAIAKYSNLSIKNDLKLIVSKDISPSRSKYEEETLVINNIRSVSKNKVARNRFRANLHKSKLN